MKIKTLNLLIIFMLICNCIYSDGCINIFQQSAMDCEPDYFFIYDDFTILGNIEINRKNVILANNVHYWGASTSRATSRFLLFLDNGTFLGMYSGIVFNPTRIEIIGQRIIIPVDDPEIGNVIDFSAGIPNEVWIDGHIFSYTEINSIGH